MKYFRYVNGRNNSPLKLAKIFNAVQKMTDIAKSRYGVRYQDALDSAFFHIVDNYDESYEKDEDALERYTASVVSKIKRSEFRHEVLSDTALDIGMEKKSCEDERLEETQISTICIDSEKELDEDVSECISEILPNFLKDFEVFNSKSQTARRTTYNNVYERYSNKVLLESVKRLSNYYEDAKHLSCVSKTCKMRSFRPDRYKSSMDGNIKICSVVNGIIICSVKSNNVKRSVYMVHLQDFIDCIFEDFYSKDDSIGHRCIYGHDVYCTLSGKLVEGEETLRKALEKDIVGSMLARMVNVKTVKYQEGKCLFISSSKDEEPGITFNIFGVESVLQMSRMTIRRVVS